jgi:2-keto-3-deoxy-galactonokinase
MNTETTNTTVTVTSLSELLDLIKEHSTLGYSDAEKLVGVFYDGIRRLHSNTESMRSALESTKRDAERALEALNTDRMISSHGVFSSAVADANRLAAERQQIVDSLVSMRYLIKELCNGMVELDITSFAK